MLMGLSWLGGLIQIAVDVAFHSDDRKSRFAPQKKEFVDKATQLVDTNFSSTFLSINLATYILKNPRCTMNWIESSI